MTSMSISEPAKPLTPKARRIDVHAHFVPDFYRRAAEDAGFGKPDGMPGIPKWSLESALATMDRNDIEVAMLSISAPGIHFGDVCATISLARRVNEYAAEIVAKHPGRFGFFAMLPLPDVEAALQEAAFALDVLKADGIVITSNQDGIYPGDPRYEPIFADLGSRKANLFIHPTSPSCTCEGGTDLNFPRPIIEFMFETTRVVTNLILTGTTRRHAGLQLIIPHAGAALPVLADRIAGVLGMLPMTSRLQPDDVFSELRRIFYDVAGFALPRLLPALLEIVDHDHLLYGSDWPHSPEPVITKLIADLENASVFDAPQLNALWHGNARSLFPRLSCLAHDRV
jgi:predicted TIM-barrel fold metal-dependent hydrolase